MKNRVSVAIVAVCLLQPSICGADRQDNRWPARYVAGSKKSNVGAKLELIISSQGITGKKGKKPVLEIPAGSITEVGYDNSSHNKGWTWLKTGSEVVPQGKCSGGSACGVWPLTLVPVLVGAAALAPYKSTQHFVRILWQDSGVPSEALFEVGKDDYSAVLTALQNLTGKPWQDLPEARKKLLGEIDAAKDRSVPLRLDRAVVLNEAEMKPGNYRLIVLERPENRAEAYFFAGPEVKPEHVTAQAVGRIEASQAETASSAVAYVQQMGAETIATIQLPDRKLMFDSGGLPARVARSSQSFYGGSTKWATVIRTDYKGEPALRFYVIHNPFPHVCQEYVYVTHTRVASEIAPSSPQSGCATFSAQRSEVKAVTSDGKWTNRFLDVTVGDKSYNLQPLLEEGNGNKRIATLGKSRDAAREWAAFFVQTVTDFDNVEQGSQTPAVP